MSGRMPITLKSRVPQMQVFSLPHDSCCKTACTCSEITVAITKENPRNGERARTLARKKVPSSITFLAREEKRDLPDAILAAPDVKAALAVGSLRLAAQTSPIESAAGPAPATPAMRIGGTGE